MGVSAAARARQDGSDHATTARTWWALRPLAHLHRDHHGFVPLGETSGAEKWTRLGGRVLCARNRRRVGPGPLASKVKD